MLRPLRLPRLEGYGFANGYVVVRRGRRRDEHKIDVACSVPVASSLSGVNVTPLSRRQGLVSISEGLKTGGGGGGM